MLILIIVCALALLATLADAITTQIGIGRGFTEINTLLGGKHPRPLIIWLPNMAVTLATIGFCLWLGQQVPAAATAIFPGIVALAHGVCAFFNWKLLRLR